MAYIYEEKCGTLSEWWGEEEEDDDDDGGG